MTYDRQITTPPTPTNLINLDVKGDDFYASPRGPAGWVTGLGVAVVVGIGLAWLAGMPWDELVKEMIKW